MDNLEYNLCPSSNIKPTPAFKSQEEYEQFRIQFAESVKPQLEKYRLARIRSEEAARRHWIN